MDHHPQIPARDLETVRLEALLPQPWQQALVSADLQAEVPVLDYKVRQLVSADQASLAVVHHLASLLASLLLGLLLLASVDLLVDLPALHRPLVAAVSHLGD